MLRKILLIGLIGGAAYGASRMMNAPAGSVESAASKAAATLREKGPGVVETVAKGTERVGRATEQGAHKLRELANTEDAADGIGPSDAENGDSAPTSDSDSDGSATTD